MKLLSIASLVLLAAVPASALFRSSRHPTKEDRRLARERNAAANGHRRLAMEDCAGEVPGFLKYFEELSDEQILAAAKLGYNDDTWDADDYPPEYEGKTWDELPADAQANFLVLDINQKVFNGYYSATFWGKLDNIDPALQPAAVTLGFTKDVWNTCYRSVCTGVQEISWFDLTQEQRQAARLFGYTCHSWEYWLGPNNINWDECVTPYYKRQWVGLPVNQKKAAKLLGYDEDSWNKDALDFPETWDLLTEKQQELFAELGYTEALYNEYFYFNWSELPKTVQSAAQTLLLNQYSWQTCYADKLSGCTHMTWGQLTLDQKTAATEIGYTCWDYDE